jgi:hypothetical protein
MVLLLLKVVAEWGVGAVVVLIIFEIDDDKEGTRFDERIFLPELSGSI